MSSQKPRVALLNWARLNFDQRLNHTQLDAFTSVTSFRATEPLQFVEHAGSNRILVSKELEMGRDIIQGLPAQVEMICEAGTGFDNIDTNAARARGMVVCNVPGYSTESVAQLTLGFILALSTGMHRVSRSVATGDRKDFDLAPRPMHSETLGKTLGVIGGGTIGGRVVQLARAFGMEVRVTSRNPRRYDDKHITWVPVTDLDRFLEECDFVTLHCPLSDETRHLINRKRLGRMRKTAFLINTARGELVEPEALNEALRTEQIAGAALDVQDPEPPPADSVLWTLPNVILTPHIGWKSIEARERLMDVVAGNIKAYLEGSPINTVGNTWPRSPGTGSA